MHTAAGTVENFDGYVKGIVTKVNKNDIDVKVISLHNNITGLATEISYKSFGLNRFPDGSGNYYQVFNNAGTATSLEKFRFDGFATYWIGSTVVTFPSALPVSSINVGDLIQSLNGALSGKNCCYQYRTTFDQFRFSSIVSINYFSREIY
jgi:hypothetical protein